MSTGQKMSTRPVVKAVDGTELVLCLVNGTNYLVPLGLLANLTGDPEYTKQGLGLDKVDNTSDAEKPLSDAAVAALAAKLDQSALSGAIDSLTQQFEGQFAVVDHTHLIEDVQGLQGELDRRVTIDTVSSLIEEGKIGLAVEASVADRLAGKADKTEIQGILTALTGKASLAEVEAAIANLVTEEQLLAAVASKADVASVAALAQAVDAKADAQALQDLAASIENVVTVETVDQKITDAMANSGHVTAETVDQKVVEAIANSGHVTAETLDGAVSAAVADLSTKQDLQEGLAGKVDVAALETLATKDEVAVVQQDLAGKMSAQEVQNALTGYALQADVAQQISSATEGKVNAADLTALQAGITAQIETKVSKSQHTQDMEGKASLADVQAIASEMASKADATAIPDVSAFVDMSQVAQAVQSALTATQDFVRADEEQVSRLMWVCGKAVPGANGSINRPFETIQQAIDAIPGSATGFTIMVMPRQSGSYAGYTVDSKQNLQVQGFGANGAHTVVINGTVVYSGATTTRVRLRDIQIKAPLNGQAMIFDGTQGRHYFQNVTIEPASGTIAPTVVFKNGYKNWTSFDDCSVSGDVSIEATVEANSAVYFNGNNSATNVYVDGPARLIVRQGIQFGYIEQNAGEIDVRNVSSFEGKNGYAIVVSDDTLKRLATMSCMRNNAGTLLKTKGFGANISMCDVGADDPMV